MLRVVVARVDTAWVFRSIQTLRSYERRAQAWGHRVDCEVILCDLKIKPARAIAISPAQYTVLHLVHLPILAMDCTRSHALDLNSYASSPGIRA